MIRILSYENAASREEIFAHAEPMRSVADSVSAILADVREEGDRALLRYTEKLDGVSLSSLEVSEEEIEEAMHAVPEKLLAVMREAAANIRAFHEKQTRSSFIITERDGVVIGQRVIPLDHVGLYVPGGTAAYPSTVLMDSIPAKIAGCPELIMTTPPGKDGRVAPVILAAAKIAGIDRIFKVGGAQAIGALAYGTESIPRVDKIVGPGNAYVAEAKKQVFGQVAIDMIAGPSEILIVADGNNRACDIAADLLSQAEHDKNASAVLVTDDAAFAAQVRDEVERQLACLPRAAIASESILQNGKIILVPDLNTAIEISNLIAPEHLELCVDDPFAWLGKVKHAGSVFLGRYCPEALGDYFAGPNHTLPTSGTARFSSPLSVDDFVKKSQYTYYTKDALSQCADAIAAFARQEGLEAHARSAEIRLEEIEGGAAQ